MNTYRITPFRLGPEAAFLKELVNDELAFDYVVEATIEKLNVENGKWSTWNVRDSTWVEDEEEEPFVEVTDDDIIKMMETYGGSFVKSLARTWMLGDIVNKALIKSTWSNLWANYAEMAKYEKASRGE